MELICFPSADPLQDLLLPLHLQATAVYLPTPPGRRTQAERLARVLRDRAVAVHAIDWPAIGGFDGGCDEPAAEVLRRLGPAFEAIDHGVIGLALGASAGPWELIVQQVLRDLLGRDEFRVFALSSDGMGVLQLEPGPVVCQPLEVALRPADYLAACNATLRDSASERPPRIEAMQHRRGLTLQMARDCAALGPALGTLNHLAHRALDERGERLTDPKQHLPFDAAAPLRRALNGLGELGLVDFDGQRELIFCSADACRYVGGGWMEEYAWLTASELGADHVHAGLELTWNTGPGIAPRNELDLFVLQGHRALTVECKAGFMGEGEETARVLYKLDSIADRLSALPGNAVLLSAREVPELIKKRARAQGTAVFDGPGLVDFQAGLRAWLEGQSLV